jgi:hypothetical protein
LKTQGFALFSRVGTQDFYPNLFRSLVYMSRAQQTSIFLRKMKIWIMNKYLLSVGIGDHAKDMKDHEIDQLADETPQRHF